LTSAPERVRPRDGGRRAYIDWARGVAVILMIEAHTLDAWTRAADRSTVGFRNATILAGFAAPLFLWLAGVGLVLSATRTAVRHDSRAVAVEAVCRRGLEIFALAFLFRLQAFIISPGSHPVALFRVDILNVMGPAIAASALVWGLARSKTRLLALYAATAAAIAMVTPIVRGCACVDALPTWLQWYVRPAGEHTTFTLFPWAGFVFAGAACGVLLAAVADRDDERRLHGWLGAAGAALIVAGLYASTLPPLYRDTSFWTSSPTYFAIRTGVMMVAFSGLYGLARLLDARTDALKPVERLGRSSLFVYWIHVELVYGYASWFWRGRLPLWGTAIGFAAFSALMYATLVARDRFIARGPRITLHRRALSVSSAP
jgi:uncharacterized membrane protein